MTPHDSLPNPDNRLLQRYREANAHDAARPAPALRETVLAHARAAAAARAETPSPARRPAANDSAWTWRAFGGLAVIGLAGLLVLQFERGAPEEKEAALSVGVTRPSGSLAPAPAEVQVQEAAQAPTRQPRTGPPQTATLAPKAGQIVDPEQGPERAVVPPAAAADTALRPEPPAMAAAPAPALAEAMEPRATVESRNTSEGLARERRETGAARPAPISPLLTAINAAEPAAVRQLLAKGANPNERQANGLTPLMAAARRGDEVIVRALLAAGADRALRDVQGLSAAEYAERAGHNELLLLLQ